MVMIVVNSRSNGSSGTGIENHHDDHYGSGYDGCHRSGDHACTSDGVILTLDHHVISSFSSLPNPEVPPCPYSLASALSVP